MQRDTENGCSRRILTVLRSCSSANSAPTCEPGQDTDAAQADINMLKSNNFMTHVDLRAGLFPHDGIRSHKHIHVLQPTPVTPVCAMMSRHCISCTMNRCQRRHY